jgi:inner membrane protein
MAAARWRERRGAALVALAPSMIGWAMLSMLPDSDVIGFSFGIPYESIWGHRGATHSFAFALLVGAAVAVVVPPSPRLPRAGGRRWAPAWPAGLLAGLVVCSHGLLDSLTDGGRGVALLWPFTAHRYFAPWHPIPVSPIGFGLLSSFGMRVALHELLLFAPLFAYALWPRRARRRACAV